MELSLKNLLVVLLLPSLPLATSETVIGAYIYHRHGDRTAKSWPPVVLTSLGADEVYASGSYYRDLYISSNSSSQIQGIASDIAVLSQLSITSPVDNVIQASALGFAQGLYPPAGSVSLQTLANGSNVESPLGGYQYIPVNAVSTAASSAGSESSTWLEGSSGCAKAVASSNNYYLSDEYLSTLNSTSGFYQGLLPVINTTFSTATDNYKNAYTIFDYVHVATIHNQTIPASDLLTNSTLHQLQTRADQHEWGLAYNSSDTVRAIAGAVLAGQVVQSLNATLQGVSGAPSLSVQFGAYSTFMSFFGLAGFGDNAQFHGICDYASSMVWELVDTSANGDRSNVSVRFLFANGTASSANPPQVYPLFNGTQTLLPWSDFVDGMQKFAVADTAAWCSACGNSTGVCAGAGSSTANTSSTGSSGGGIGGVSRPVAGVIGAVVALVAVLAVEALVMGVTGLRLAKKQPALTKQDSASTGHDHDLLSKR